MAWNQSWPTVRMQQRKGDLTALAEDLRNLSATKKGNSKGRKNRGDQLDAVSYVNHLSRYLIIRSAGYVEITRDDCIDQYTSVKSIPLIHSYVRSGLYTGYGVSPGQLSAFVQKFSPEWKQELENILVADDENLKRILGQLVSERKSVAHGGSTQVSQRKALDMYECAVILGDWFIKRYDPRG